MIFKKGFNEKCETIVGWLTNETYRQNYNVEAKIFRRTNKEKRSRVDIHKQMNMGDKQKNTRKGNKHKSLSWKFESNW